MGDVIVIFYILRRKIMFKITKQSNHRVLRNNGVDTYGPPVFAPDYSATG